MTFAQRRNRLTTHFSERIPVVMRHISVFVSILYSAEMSPNINVYIMQLFFFLGAFANSCKATISFVVSVRHHGTTGFPLDGFSWNFIFECFKKNLSRKFKSHYNLTTITGTVHADRYTFCITSPSVLLRMRNVSDKSCTENQNTHFVFCDFFPKIVPFVR